MCSSGETSESNPSSFCWWYSIYAGVGFVTSICICLEFHNVPAMMVSTLVLQPKYSRIIKLCQGWGLLSQFLPFRYFPNFSALSKQTLAIEYHVYIWQVSPQLSCGDTCQIWMWFEKSNMYFCHIENFAYGEINERSFSNPHPGHHQHWYWIRRSLFSMVMEMYYEW